MHKTVVITGCSSGIGRASAETLQKAGYRVIATARKEEDIKALKETGFLCVELDLNDSDSIERAVQEILTLSEGSVYAIFNNAGYGETGAFEDLTREMLRNQFETNVFGLVEFTNKFLPIMRKQGTGRIVNMSSMLGVVSFPYRGAYSASKFALEALSDALRMECHDINLSVSLIEAGPIESRFRDRAISQFEKNLQNKNSDHSKLYQRMYEQFKQNKSKMTFTLKADAVAKKVLHAVSASRPKARYCVTFPAYLFAFLRRILPTFVLDWFI